NGRFENDYATVAYDTATGQPQWTKEFDGGWALEDEAVAITLSPDGSGVYVTGKSVKPVGGQRVKPAICFDTDYATVAYRASTGEELWSARYRDYNLCGANQDVVADIATDGQRVFVTGRTSGKPDNADDYGTVAYDAATGQQIWERRYDGPDG